jgi:hypothetical protein
MLHITHDNGNHVCFSDGSTYVRQDRAYFDADGMSRPAIAAVLSALDTHVLRQGGLI